MRRYIDLVLIADTHELHHEVDVPPGDILIHAGDFTMFSKRLSAIEDFNDWLGEPVAIAEVVMCIVERRRRLQVQRR